MSLMHAPFTSRMRRRESARTIALRDDLKALLKRPAQPADFSMRCSASRAPPPRASPCRGELRASSGGRLDGAGHVSRDPVSIELAPGGQAVVPRAVAEAVDQQSADLAGRR